MGFRTGSYAKVWKVERVSDVFTKIQISISRKNKNTGEYETDFSGFVACIGSLAAKKAASLKEGDKIKLGDVDVSTNYNKETHITYTNYKMFSFELAEDGEANPSQPQKPALDSNAFEGETDEDKLPF